MFCYAPLPLNVISQKAAVSETRSADTCQAGGGNCQQDAKLGSPCALHLHAPLLPSL